MEAIGKEVPGRLRWKKYPLCTKNLTGMQFSSLFSLFIKSDKDFGLRIGAFYFHSCWQPVSKSNAHPDTIKPVLTPAETAELKADPCYPDRYSTMAAEVQLTQKISDWWQSDKFKAWSNKVCNDNVHCIQDAYLVTNAGITRTYRY